MRHRIAGSIGFAAMLAAALSLGACSSMLPGNSSYGKTTLTTAELPAVGDMAADQALSQARDHFRNSDFGYSAALYKKYIELTPNDPQGYVGLGASYDRLGRFDLSDKVYASLYDLSGGTAQYFNNVGYSYMLRGNLTAALTNFRKAHKLDPDNVVIDNNLQILSDASGARA